ncbi:hypothetical protein [Chitinophaga qingshengii]|uniref:MoxR-vWA-beta-propeller ternary system domain-containing protein n=1 Tax=Chitinophaga qingshengii TaxID=1569794 RepID=A0ABR7TMC9_9BACT|nr:hypothetical protein [Chitinophaga qingshengii]MBC9930219.1 hypothetical protein [Chitinophaga qingshengii]
MNLTVGLQYQDNAPQPAIAAAFVYGHSAAVWMEEISRWQLPMEQLTALAVPQRDSAATAGLLVLFNGVVPPFPERLQHPYQRLRRLFIPVNAVLTPAMTDDERKNLLIWDWQLFHPVLGFTGFHQEQLISLSSLLTLPAPLPGDWEQARMGTFPAPSLQRISLEVVTLESIFTDIQQQIGRLSPENIAPAAPEPENNSLLNKARSIFSALFKPGTSPEVSPDEQRRRALDRLQALFDIDFNKALEYAIPLGDAYASRGSVANEGTSLSRQDTDFSLGKLGGGQPVDYWNLSGYKERLREKYQIAAHRATQAGDYRKAAYIYAHLLNDFCRAAQVLEKGGFYREAAVLYTDHLKDDKAAAEVLEKGGFLEEAIPLYIKTTQYEKAGDLLIQLHRHAAAMEQYQSVIDGAVKQEDYPFAANIALHKMQDKEKAGEYLLTSWHKKIAPQQSLRQYFQLQDDSQLQQTINDIYHHHTAAGQETDLLAVLKTLTIPHPDPAIRDTGVEIVYDMASKKNKFLSYLRDFIPDDLLLWKDIKRYTRHTPASSTTIPARRVVQFAKDIKWQSGVRLPRQMVFLGHRGNQLYLLNYNMADKSELILLKETKSTPPPITMIVDPGREDYVLLLSNDLSSVNRKTIRPGDSTQDFISVEMPAWTPGSILAAQLKGSKVMMLHNADGALHLASYLMFEQKWHTTDCHTGNQPIKMEFRRGRVQETFSYQGCYYFFSGYNLFRCNHAGETESFGQGNKVLSMSPSFTPDSLKLAIATTDGVRVLLFTGSSLSAQSTYIIKPATYDTVMTWLPGSLLAIGTEQRVEIYRISGSQASTALVAELHLTATVKAILLMPQPAQIGVLDEAGLFSIFDLKL